jgi:glycine/D-amino acid oxidase-like deaminating enzyme
MERSAQPIAACGAGELRLHRSAADSGYGQADSGADLLLDPDLIHRHFPYLHPEIVAALHVRRAGWFSAQQLGMYLLEQARQAGVRLVSGKLSAVEQSGGRVAAVQLADGTRIDTPVFVNAGGPFLKPVGALLGVELPVYNELHLKLAFKDAVCALDRQAPLVILSDPQALDWSADEREWLADEPDQRFLLDELPAGLHTRPEGGADSPIILVLWEYKTRRMQPVWPLPEDPLYADVLLRGLPRLIPAMQAYVQKAPRPRVDGGYYTRTVENHPLIGKLPVEGAFVIGALSGFGMMASSAAGELLSRHVTGAELPEYAPAFELERYADPEYAAKLAGMGESGQL